MTEFTDSKGTQWKLRLSTGMILDIEEETKVSLDDMIKQPSKFADLMLTEPRKLVEVLFVLCREQAESIPISDRDFGRRFDRDTLDAAADAFLKEVLTFYPRTSAGKVLAEKFPELMAKMDREIEAKANKEIQKVLLS